MNSRSAFVAIGLAVNLLVMGRGVALMLALGYADLGFVALVQAAITFIAMMHFGLLNGGYRLLCHAGPRTRQRIIDLAYTGFAGISGSLILIGLVVGVITNDPAVRHIAAFSILGGVATLMRSWLMNEMVAGQRLRSANIINATSTLASLAALLLLIPQETIAPPALIAVGAIVVQPVAFVALALVSGAALRPQSLRVSTLLSKHVIKAGFLLFAAGLALQLIPLIERAYVSQTLGLEALGRLYLAILFVTLFQMAPNLIQQVFLAPVVELSRKREAAAIQRELRQLLLVCSAYCAAAALALWLLAEPILTLLLPDYVADLRWVYLLAPGLIVFALCAPFTLSFNVMIDYRWYLIAYASGALITVFAFAAATVFGIALNLDQVIFLRSASFAVMGTILIFGAHQITRRAPQFRVFGHPAFAT